MQRWLFRRELEKRAPASVYYLDECGVDHRLYREYGRAPRGERIYETVAGRRRERTSVIAACQNGKRVAPLTFAGTCNTAVVDGVFCAGAPAGAAPGQRDRAGQRPLPSVANHGGAGRRRRLPTVVPAVLLA